MKEFKELFPNSVTGQISAVVLGLLLIVKLCQWGLQERKTRLLGGRAYRIKSYVPLGLDVILRTIYDAMRFRDLDAWTEWFRDAADGATAEFSLAGVRCIVTVNSENIKTILTDQFGEYGKGKHFHDDWKAFLGDSIFTTDVFERHVQKLILAITEGDPVRANRVGSGEQILGLGRTVDINDLLLRYTLDIATEFLLGTSVDSIRTPRQDFAEAFAEVQRIQNFMTRSGPANVFIPKGSYNAGIRTIVRFIDPFIEEALSFSPDELAKNMESKYTFLQALASATKDRKFLWDQIVAILLAGRDTTAAAPSWAMYELAQHPGMVRKLRAEIVDNVGLEAAPTYRNLKDMKYLRRVLDETLRLYPSVPFNLRIALTDTSLPRGGGSFGEEPVGVLKDTIIGHSVLAMQRREDLYPANARSLVFDPDGWLKWKPKYWHYLPFNGGPRMCVRRQFALTEAGYTLVRLFQRFETLQGFECHTTHFLEYPYSIPYTVFYIVFHELLSGLDSMRCQYGEPIIKL